MEEINDLKKKVNHLEYEEIKSIKEDISNIKSDLKINNLLTQQSIESSDKLSSTLDNVKDTMLIMSESMKRSNEASENLAKSVKSLENKVDVKFDEQEKRMDEIDDKSKIDLVKSGTNTIANNIWKYILLAIGFGGIGSLLSTFIK